MRVAETESHGATVLICVIKGTNRGRKKKRVPDVTRGALVSETWVYMQQQQPSSKVLVLIATLVRAESNPGHPVLRSRHFWESSVLSQMWHLQAQASRVSACKAFSHIKCKAFSCAVPNQGCIFSPLP